LLSETTHIGMEQINGSINKKDYAEFSAKEQILRKKLEKEIGPVTSHMTEQITGLITGKTDELCAMYAVKWEPEMSGLTPDELGKAAVKKGMSLVSYKRDDFSNWQHFFFAYCLPSRAVKCAQISFKLSHDENGIQIEATHKELDSFTEELEEAIRKVFKL